MRRAKEAQPALEATSVLPVFGIILVLLVLPLAPLRHVRPAARRLPAVITAIVSGRLAGRAMGEKAILRSTGRARELNSGPTVRRVELTGGAGLSSKLSWQPRLGSTSAAPAARRRRSIWQAGGRAG